MTRFDGGAFAGPKGFARWFLKDGLSHPSGMQSMRCTDRWIEVVLFRSGPWQAQLSIILPGVTVPEHRHLRCDSYDLPIAGAGVVNVFPGVVDFPIRNVCGIAPAAQLMHVPLGAWHGGVADKFGSALISFQRWSGEPDFISNDWESRNA